MSDHAILDDEDFGEFREPLNLALDGAGLEAFKWLIVGHLAFILGLFAVVLIGIDRGMVWITPLFGLPLLWRGRDHRALAKAIVFLLGFTAAHYGAVEAALRSYDQQSAFVPGLVGGAIGAVASLLLCALFRLLRPGASTVILAVFGTIILAAVGSLAVYLYVTTPAGEGPIGEVLHLLKVYTPWQVAFAFVLAKVLRPDG